MKNAFIIAVLALCMSGCSKEDKEVQYVQVPNASAPCEMKVWHIVPDTSSGETIYSIGYGVVPDDVVFQIVDQATVDYYRARSDQGINKWEGPQ